MADENALSSLERLKTGLGEDNIKYLCEEKGVCVCVNNQRRYSLSGQ